MFIQKNNISLSVIPIITVGIIIYIGRYTYNTVAPMIYLIDKSIQTNNVDTIDKTIQCEIPIEKMINIGDIKAHNTPSKLRWFFYM